MPLPISWRWRVPIPDARPQAHAIQIASIAVCEAIAAGGASSMSTSSNGVIFFRNNPFFNFSPTSPFRSISSGTVLITSDGKSLAALCELRFTMWFAIAAACVAFFWAVRTVHTPLGTGPVPATAIIVGAYAATVLYTVVRFTLFLRGTVKASNAT
jgi:hypothetical protein